MCVCMHVCMIAIPWFVFWDCCCFKSVIVPSCCYLAVVYCAVTLLSTSAVHLLAVYWQSTSFQTTELKPTSSHQAAKVTSRGPERVWETRVALATYLCACMHVWREPVNRRHFWANHCSYHLIWTSVIVVVIVASTRGSYSYTTVYYFICWLLRAQSGCNLLMSTFPSSSVYSIVNLLVFVLSLYLHL